SPSARRRYENGCLRVNGRSGYAARAGSAAAKRERCVKRSFADWARYIFLGRTRTRSLDVLRSPESPRAKATVCPRIHAAGRRQGKIALNLSRLHHEIFSLEK